MCIWHHRRCTKISSVRKLANARVRNFYAYENFYDYSSHFSALWNSRLIPTCSPEHLETAACHTAPPWQAAWGPCTSTTAPAQAAIQRPPANDLCVDHPFGSRSTSKWPAFERWSTAARVPWCAASETVHRAERSGRPQRNRPCTTTGRRADAAAGTSRSPRCCPTDRMPSYLPVRRAGSSRRIAERRTGLFPHARRATPWRWDRECDDRRSEVDSDGSPACRKAARTWSPSGQSCPSRRLRQECEGQTWDRPLCNRAKNESYPVRSNTRPPNLLRRRLCVHETRGSEHSRPKLPHLL